MESKKFLLFGKNGVMEELKPQGELPIGMRVYAFGGGMSEQTFCVTGPRNTNGQQEVCLVDDFDERDYFSPIHRMDKYDRPLSKKFGIGFYWDDVDNFIYPPEKVAEIKAKCAREMAAIEQRAKDQEAADRKEREEMPGLFPHLKPISKESDGYMAVRANIVAELKHRFPDFKFSIKKRGYGSIDIEWTNGPAYEDVSEVEHLFEDHSFDYSGDYHDYTPSNFNKVFGGLEYIFLEREMSEDLNEALMKGIKEFWGGTDYENEKDVYHLFKVTTIPVGAYNFRLERKENTCGNVVDFFKIGYDLPETKEVTKEEKHEPLNIKVVDYSDKSIAVIGDTFEIKDKLKEHGGRFNKFLNIDGEKKAGWVFPLSKKDEILKLI